MEDRPAEAHAAVHGSLTGGIIPAASNHRLEYSKHSYYAHRVEENLGTLLGQVARLLRRSFDERARGIGVTRPQWQVLSLLKLHPGSNQGNLAEMLDVEPITVARMIDRLQEAGLAERRADPADRRAWRVHLTGKGEGLVEKLVPFGQQTLDAALDGIEADEQTQLIATLARVRHNLSRRTAVEMAVNG